MWASELRGSEALEDGETLHVRYRSVRGMECGMNGLQTELQLLYVLELAPPV